jgi:geranylgeranyl pyrophosphate synthase
MGLEGSQAYAQQLLAKAIGSLDTLGPDSQGATAALRSLADMLVNRQH